MLHPGFFLLLLIEHPDGSFLRVSLGLLVVLALALTDLRLEAQSPLMRVSVAWVLAAGSFYLAGVWPCLLLILLIVLKESWQGRAPVALGCALSALVVPGWVIWSSYPKPAKILVPWETGTPLILTAALYLFSPLTAVALKLTGRPWQHVSKSAEVHPARRSRLEPWLAIAGRQGCLLALLSAGWLWVWLGFDEPRWAPARIDYYVNHGQNAAAIRTAADPKLQPLDPSSEIRLQRALYHAGRLCEDLFAFRNQTRWTVLPDLRGGLRSCRAQSETLLDLGLVNDAEHLAHEALEFEGARPDLLARLAQVNVLKHRPRAARVFLTVLEQVPFESPAAAQRVRELDADPLLSSDADLDQLRARIISRDLPHAGLPVEDLLTELLAENPQNRMAYEYLLAHYLLQRNLDKLVQRLQGLDRFGYANIPRHCEEALLLYDQQTGGKFALTGHPVRSRTIQRFQQFARAMQQQLYKDAAGRAVLAREFGDTYWFYFFGSPTGSNQNSGGNPS